MFPFPWVAAADSGSGMRNVIFNSIPDRVHGNSTLRILYIRRGKLIAWGYIELLQWKVHSVLLTFTDIYLILSGLLDLFSDSVVLNDCFYIITS